MEFNETDNSSVSGFVYIKAWQEIKLNEKAFSTADSLE